MLESRQWKTCSWFLAIGISVLALSGCGGGGGGGNDGPTSPSKAQTPPPEQTPLEKTPLAFTRGTAQNAATQSFREVELALLYTHSATQVLSRSNIPMGTSTRSCLQSGTENIDFADVDNSGSPTKGDTVSVRYEDCSDEPGLTLKGQYVVTLDSPPTGSEGVAAFGGVIQFAQFNAMVTDTGTPINVTPTGTKPSSLVLNGNVTFSSSVDARTRTLIAQTDEKGLKMDFQDPVNPRTETLILKDARKTLDHAEATYQLSLDAVLQSQVLSGEIKLLTPVSVTGRLNSFPREGYFQVQGAVANVQVVGNSGTSKLNFMYSDGTTKPENLNTVDWSDISSLFYFWDSDHGSPEDVVVTPPDVLYNSIPVSGMLSTNPEILLQLSRPLAQGTVPAFVFQPQQPSSAASVNAIVGVNGARLTLKPALPLEATTAYMVVPNRDNYPDRDRGALVIPSFGFSTE